MTSFFSVKLNGFELSLFHNFSSIFSTSKPEQNNSSLYLNLDLKELALLAKNNQSAKDEFIKRNIPRVHSVVKKYLKLFHLESYMELFETGIDSLSSIIDSFDESKGRIDHFVTFAIKRHIRFKCIKIKRTKERIASYFGNKVDYELLTSTCQTSSFDVSPNKISGFIDFVSYTSSFPRREKGILYLYLRGFKLADIAKRYDISICTVSNTLYKLFARLQNRISYLNYKYISNNI